MKTSTDLKTAQKLASIESYFSDDEDLSDCQEEPLFEDSSEVSVYICHVKIKKAISKADDSFLDEINRLRFEKSAAPKIPYNRQTLVAEIKLCSHKTILCNALELLECEGVFDCVCYLLELGEHRLRGRLVPMQIRQKRLPAQPDINEI